MADYRDAKTYKSSTEAAKDRTFANAGTMKDWWRVKDEDERTKAVVDSAKALEANSKDRHQANLRHARLYENVELDSLGGSEYASSLVRQAIYGAGMMRFNVTAACVDTLAAKIVKNNPRPAFITSGGTWTAQQKAKRLDKFTRGLFYETKFAQHASKVFFDAVVFGTGLLHVYEGQDKRLECERVLPDEMYIDDMDAMYGEPRNLYRRKIVSKDVLAANYKKYNREIWEASLPEEQRNGPSKASVPCVEVWEAWHLPSTPKAGDGKHIIAIDGCELLCEDWKLDTFPFVTLRYKDRTVGYWGKGVVESLVGIQIELNRLVSSVSEQLRRKGRNQVFLQYGSKVNPEKLTNAIGDIVWYNGAEPKFNNQNAVSSEDFMQIDRLYQRAFQEVGISELSAAAKKPSGLDAAVALREYSDIESERFALVHKRWEQFALDFSTLALEMISKQTGSEGYKIRLPSKRFVIEVDWKDINLDRDSYIMQMFPVSSLPSTPGARYQKVREMMQDGFIDKPVAQRLLEFPDLEAETNLGNAAIDDADATISAILDDETPVLHPYEPYQNADLIISRGTAAYLYAKEHGCEDNRLEMLRRLIDGTTAAKAKMMQPPMPPPGAMPPGAPPGAPPGDVTINNQMPMNPAVPPVVA